MRSKEFKILQILGLKSIKTYKKKPISNMYMVYLKRLAYFMIYGPLKR